MPRLIYRGDSTENFGRLLPAPYIENIVINNTTMDIIVSLFINAPEDVDDSDEIIELVKESVYLNFVIAANMSEDDVNSFTSGQLNLLEYIAENRSTEGSEAFYISALYGDDPAVRAIEWEGFLDDYEDYSSIIYDEHGNRFKRITKTYSDIAISNDYEANDIEYTFYLTNYYEDGIGYTVDNLYFMVFSSMVDLQTEDWDYAFDDVSAQAVNLMAKEISNVSYEKIIEDGAIVPQTEVIWVDKKNTPYDGIPIQSLTSQYFKSENITLEEIVDSMEDLLEAYETEANKHPKSDLASAVNNIAYVLSVYGGNTQLLPQLNLLKKMFTSKSTVKPVGKLYARFRKRLFTFNKAVVNEDRVFKKLVVNPKILDNTDPIVLNYETNEQTSYDGNEIIYQKWYGGSQALLLYAATYDATVADYHAIVNGFFFVDYQKLLDNCNAMKIYDLSKLKDYFGEEALKERFNITQVVLNKNEIDSGYLTSYITAYGRATSNYTKTNYTRITPNASNLLTMAEYATHGSYYSYLQLRNFNLTRSGSAFADYAMMTFEFQMVVEGYNALTPDTYEFQIEVSVDDQTSDIVKYLTGSLFSASNSFIDNYLDYAQDPCSYNSIDGKFNQFFIDGMNTTYEGNMENAPWLVSSFIYCLHKDLLFDEFDGDSSKILEGAKKISMKISPYTGILGQAESFSEAMISLYDNFYGGYEDETTYANAIDLTIPLELNYMDNGYHYRSEEDTKSTTLDKIPSFYVEDVPEEPEEEVVETEAWAWALYSGTVANGFSTLIPKHTEDSFDWSDLEIWFQTFYNVLLEEYGTTDSANFLIGGMMVTIYNDISGGPWTTSNQPSAAELIETVNNAMTDTPDAIGPLLNIIGTFWANMVDDSVVTSTYGTLNNLFVDVTGLSIPEMGAIYGSITDWVSSTPES